MPRKSAASAATTSIDAKAGRVQPPAGLPEPAKQQWLAIVNSLPADRFHPSDRPLLSLYCQTLVRAQEAMDQLDKAADPVWLKFTDTLVKLSATLATKLRLCPQARLDRKVAGPMARGDAAKEKPWD